MLPHKTITTVSLLATIVSFAAFAKAADYTATVTFNVDTSLSINYKSRGVNNEMQRNVVRFDNPDFAAATSSCHFGFVRWPGGTNIGFYNWKIGYTGMDMLQQVRTSDQYLVYVNTIKGQYGVGPDRIPDFKQFLQNVGAKTVVPVNIQTQDVPSVTDLAKYIKDNNIPVIYWELSNEPYFLTGLNKFPQYFKDATDYLNKARPYYDAIKAQLPGAVVLVSYGELNKVAWNNDIYAYAAPYWDGITFHRYEGVSGATDVTVKSLNTAISNTVGDINNSYLAKMQNPNAPIFIGELGTDIPTIWETVYHGIFNTETILRAITHPNVMYIGGYRLTNGYACASDTHVNDGIDKFQRNQVADSSAYDYGFYVKAPAVMSGVMDVALNDSSAYWNTVVAGGTTVDKTSGAMPALYAQAFKGDNGKDYVVIVNKSAYSHDVELRKTENAVTSSLSAPLSMAYAEAPAGNLLAQNTGNTPTQVAVVTGSTGNPVLVEPYSVTRIEWASGRAALVKKTYITHADVTAPGTIGIKWIGADGADSYKVYYGLSSGNYTFTPISTNDTKATLTGLTAGATYYIAVESCDSSGAVTNMSENEVSLNLSAPPTPVMRSAYVEGSGSVGVEWQSAPRARGYKVRYGTSSGSYTTTVDVGNVCGTIIKGLTNGQAYYFVVTAHNGYGDSAYSAEDPAYPNDGIAYAPNNVRVASQTSTSATLAWDQSYSDTFRGYFEDGDGTSSGWTVDAGTAFAVAAHPDPERLTNTFTSTSTGTNITTRGSASMDNYEVDAKVAVAAYTGRIGLVARFQDTGNYYYFTYGQLTQQFRLTKRVGGVETLIQSVPLADSGVGDSTQMRMIIRMEGSSIKCFIGSELLIETTDSDLATGKFGLWTNNQLDAHFDEVTLRQPTTVGTSGTYILFRSTNPNTGFTQIASAIQNETYTDNTCVAGTIYYYRLKGVNSVGTSVGFSNTVTKK